jgi:hypothetical protein
MGSLFATALARAQGFLVEPAPVSAIAQSSRGGAVQVVVTAMSRGSGATTIARALAQALWRPGVRSAHLISLRPEPHRAPTGVSAWELPPALRDPTEIADYGNTLARLAGGGGEAALVWDVCADDVERAARAIERCDAVVCVAEGGAEPALCTLVCDMLAERYECRVLLVPNRAGDEEDWAGRDALCVPDSRFAALLVARGRAPTGAFGEAIARIAARVEERA